MVSFARFALLVCSLSVSGCGQGQPPPSGVAATPASAVVAYADLPTRLCLDMGRVRVEDVREGRVRLWLQLRNRRASTRYSPAFTLSAMDADGVRFWQETFAMHADRVEPATGAPEPQRFLFHMGDVHPGDAADDAEPADKLCFQLERASAAAGAADDADAAVEIELRWHEADTPAR